MWVWIFFKTFLWTFLAFLIFQQTCLFTVVSTVVGLHEITSMVVEVFVKVWNFLLHDPMTCLVFLKQSTWLASPSNDATIWEDLLPMTLFESELLLLFLELLLPFEFWIAPPLSSLAKICGLRFVKGFFKWFGVSKTALFFEPLTGEEHTA